MNPVNGVVGLLRTGNWHVCQAAVETVLGGGEVCNVAEKTSDIHHGDHDQQLCVSPVDLDLCLTPRLNITRMEEVGGGIRKRRRSTNSTARETTPSEESETTTLGSNYSSGTGERKTTLKLFLS